MKKIPMFIALFILLMGCYDKKRDTRQNNPSHIFSHLFVEVFDSLEDAYEFKGKFLTHSDLYPDIIKSESVARLEGYLKADTTEIVDDKLMLLARLNEVVNDSVSISLREIKTMNATLLFYETDSLLHSPNFFGTFGMTNPVFDDTGEKCAFYLAINCGNNCSRGFIFFAYKESNVWKVQDYYQVWG